MASHTLALHASDPATYEGYASAALRAGLDGFSAELAV
jgi:hypothetical protein